MKRCYDCQKELSIASPVALVGICPHCNQPLHCCFNCHYFSPGSQFQCLQSMAAPIESKKQGNNCQLFEFRDVEVQKSVGSQVSAKNKLDDLFKRL